MDFDASSPSDEDRLAALTNNYHRLLGLRPRLVEAGETRVELVVTEDLLRSHGMAHGGAIASMLDMAAGLAATSVAPEGHLTVTVQLNVHFVRQARLGDVLIGTGAVQHSGRRTAVATAEIRNAAGKLVATASGTFLYTPRDEAPQTS